MERELRTLGRFIWLYCRDCHAERPKAEVVLKTHDIRAICRRKMDLCPSCAKLLAHAFVKRSHCPMDPKPMCKKCPNHCYAPRYRQEIRAVMRHSGRKMIMRGRIDYLFHLFF